MRKAVFILLFIVCYCNCYGSNDDSLFVISKSDNWVIAHIVRPGETIFSISRRFHVPPAVLSDATGLTYQAVLEDHSIMNIPVGPYNFVKDKPVDMSDARAMYYRVKNENDIYHISRCSNVPQRIMQQWNNLSDNSVQQGQVLFVGWVLYDATQLEPMDNNTQEQAASKAASMPGANTAQQNDKYTHTEIIKMALPDTATHITPEEEAFNAETDSGRNVTTENGRAVFFESVAHDNVFYAFHNGTPRNRIIKVVNPGNGKTIYVKVIGPIPEIKLYANSVIGITSAAKEALGVDVEDKVFVDLSFAQ